MSCKAIIGMKNPFHYRNKVHAVFDRDKRGNIISGIYQENSHDVIPVETCLIEDKRLMKSSVQSGECSNPSKSAPMTRTRDTVFSVMC